MNAWRAGRDMLCLSPLLVAACAEFRTTEKYQAADKVTPVSFTQANDALGRQVGLLRRMAVLQLSQAPPKVCGSAYNGRMSVAAIDVVTRRILVDEKGYELVEVGAAQVPAALVDEIRLWSGPEKPASAGPVLASWIEVQRDGLQVDAVLVRLDRVTCLMAEDPSYRVLQGVSSLGMSELLPPRPHADPIFPVAEAWVFEAKTGKLVWRHAVRPWQTAHRELRGSSQSPVVPLLEPLETAIPRVLTR
jgi:hypothetical protein